MTSAVASFVVLFRQDRESGAARPLSEYLRLFPGDEVGLARAYAELMSDGQVAGRSSNLEMGGRLGSYRLLEELGRGGQGVVYLAEDEKLRRPVALKVLRDFGPGCEPLVARFFREAEVASHLNHPGICTVHDAGVIDGIPFIAMEYLVGRTLMERSLPTVARTVRDRSTLRLGESEETVPMTSSPVGEVTPPDSDEVRELVGIVESVARALHAAHEAGILHRDVKPTNIMVTDDGRPVLLDFGLARFQEHEGPSITQSGELFGTPSYMSPEQLSPTPIAMDRRTDVWSLGVTLYEVLTLHRPFAGATRNALYHHILAADPVDPRAYNHAISADLKVVIETALEKPRGRRYQTALEMAEDLRHVRLFEPISARPAGRWLRLRRWSQRHPGVAASVAAAFLFLSAGLTSALFLLAATQRERDGKEAALRLERDARQGEEAQRKNAQLRFNQVHDLSLWFITDFDDSLADLPGSMEPRRALVAKGLSYLDQLSEDSEGDPDLLRSLARAYDKIGSIQGWDLFQNLGLHQDALASFAKARGILRGLIERTPDDPSLRYDDHAILLKESMVYFDMRDQPRASAALAEADAYLNDKIAKEGLTPLSRRNLAAMRLQQALLVETEGKPTESLELVAEALEVLAPLEALAKEDVHVARLFMVAHTRRGDAYGNPFKPNLSKPEQALVDFAKAKVFSEDLLAKRPRSATAIRDVMICNFKLAQVHWRMGHDDEALTHYATSRKLAQDLVSIDPTDGRAVFDLAAVISRQADSFAKSQRLDEAEAGYCEADRLYVQLQGLIDGADRVCMLRATLAETHAKFLLRQDKLERAKERYREAGVLWAAKGMAESLDDGRYYRMREHAKRFGAAMHSARDLAGAVEACAYRVAMEREALALSPADVKRRAAFVEACVEQNSATIRWIHQDDPEDARSLWTSVRDLAREALGQLGDSVPDVGQQTQLRNMIQAAENALPER